MAQEQRTEDIAQSSSVPEQQQQQQQQQQEEYHTNRSLLNGNADTREERSTAPVARAFAIQEQGIRNNSQAAVCGTPGMPHYHVYRLAPRMWRLTGKSYPYLDMLSASFFLVSALFFVGAPTVRLTSNNDDVAISFRIVGAAFFAVGAVVMSLKATYGRLWIRCHPKWTFHVTSVSFLAAGVLFLVVFSLQLRGFLDQSNYWSLVASGAFAIGSIAFLADAVMSSDLRRPIHAEHFRALGTVFMLARSTLFVMSAICALPLMQDENESESLRISEFRFCSRAAVVWLFLFGALSFVVGSALLLGFGVAKAAEAAKSTDARNQAVEGAPYSRPFNRPGDLRVSMESK